MDANEKYLWQEKRRRQPWPGGRYMQGFGRDGTYTLWLPWPTSGVRRTFRNGKLVAVEERGRDQMPELLQLRDAVLRSLEVSGPQVALSWDFVNYAAAVILANYNVTDEELEMLLGGDRWHDPMLRHLLGGDDTVNRLATLSPNLTSRMLGRPAGSVLASPSQPSPPPPPATPPPAAVPVAPPAIEPSMHPWQRAWSRMTDRFRRVWRGD